MAKAKVNRTGEIIRFCITGAVSALIDFLVCKLFLYICGSLPSPWPIIISTTAGFLVSVVANYLLSTYWVFKNVDKSVNSKNAKFITIFVLLSAVGLGLSIGVMALCEFAFKQGMNIDISSIDLIELFTFQFWGNVVFWWYFLAFCLKTIVGLVWNYFSRKLFLYKEPKNTSEENEDKENSAI